MDIISLDRNSKIMYFTYNFFTLFMVTLVVFNDSIPDDIKNSKPDLTLCIFMILVVLISLLITITKQAAYSKFILIDDKNLYICKGKRTSPTILEQIDRSEIMLIKRRSIFHNPLALVLDDGEEVVLPSYTPSRLSMFLTIPLIVLIFLCKGDVNVSKMGNSLSEALDVGFTLNSHPSKFFETILNILGWMFLFVDIFMGIICAVLIFMYLFACAIQF